jgi:hypothetical protein
MNDNELTTIVRESVADVHSATPVAQIISRGRAVRARRRLPAAAGAAAVLAGSALAVTTLLPAAHPRMLPSGRPASNPASVRLAAWTVAKQADGDIDVTINQLQNPQGLQNTLRAVGLPVNVSFSGHSPSPACQLYPTSGNVLSAVVHYGTIGSSTPLVIHPSALPAGAGLAIFVGGVSDDVSRPTSVPPGTEGGTGMSEFSFSNGHLRMVLGLEVSAVYTSKPCTG